MPLCSKGSSCGQPLACLQGRCAFFAGTATQLSGGLLAHWQAAASQQASGAGDAALYHESQAARRRSLARLLNRTAHTLGCGPAGPRRSHVCLPYPAGPSRPLRLKPVPVAAHARGQAAPRRPGRQPSPRGRQLRLVDGSGGRAPALCLHRTPKQRLSKQWSEQAGDGGGSSGRRTGKEAMAACLAQQPMRLGRTMRWVNSLTRIQTGVPARGSSGRAPPPSPSARATVPRPSTEGCCIAKPGSPTVNRANVPAPSGLGA